MRLLIIDGVRLDLDQDTAVGVTYKAGNIKDPLSQQTKTTNAFSLPSTPNNDKFFKFAANPASFGAWQSSEHVADYFQDGAHLMREAGAQLHSTAKGRYSLTLSEGASFIKELNDANLRDLLKAQFVEVDRPLRATANESYDDATTEGFYRILWSYGHDPTTDKRLAAPLAIPVSLVLTYIETELGCTVNAPADTGDIVLPYWEALVFFNNQLAGNQYRLTHVDELTIADHAEVVDWQNDNGFRFSYMPNPSDYYGDTSAMDLIKSLAALTCSDVTIEGRAVTLTRLDTVASRTPRDWTGKLIDAESAVRKFSAWDFAQKTYILHKVEKGADKLTGGALITSGASNLEPVKELQTGALVGTRYEANGETLTSVGSRSPQSLNAPLSWSELEYQFGQYKTGKESRNSVHTDAPLKALPFMQLTRSGGSLVYITSWHPFIFGTDAASGDALRALDGGAAVLNAVEYVDLYKYYTAVEHSVAEPLSYEATVLLDVLDIQRLDQGYPVLIKELGGLFYLDEVTAYNSAAKRAGTKIKITKLKA